MNILIIINTGTIHKLFMIYPDIWFLVITYHPIVEIMSVLKSIVKDVLNDFCTYCYMKKSDSVAIEIKASGGI